MTEEQFLIQQITDLRKEYEERIRPLANRLSAIRAMQPVKYFITAEQINQLKEFQRERNQEDHRW